MRTRSASFRLWILGVFAAWVAATGSSATVSASDSGAGFYGGDNSAGNDDSQLDVHKKVLSNEDQDVALDEPGPPEGEPFALSGWERAATSRPAKKVREQIKKSASVRNVPKPQRKPVKPKKQNKNRRRRAQHEGDEAGEMVPLMLPIGENVDSEDSGENGEGGSTEDEEESEQLVQLVQLPAPKSKKAGNMPMQMVMVVPSRRLITKSGAGAAGTRKTKKRGMKKANSRQKNVAFFLVAFLTGMLSLIAYTQIANRMNKDEDGDVADEATGETPPVPPTPQQPIQPGPLVPQPPQPQPPPQPQQPQPQPQPTPSPPETPAPPQPTPSPPESPAPPQPTPSPPETPAPPQPTPPTPETPAPPQPTPPTPETPAPPQPTPPTPETPAPPQPTPPPPETPAPPPEPTPPPPETPAPPPEPTPPEEPKVEEEEEEPEEIFTRPIEVPLWVEPDLEYSELDVNIMAWKHSKEVCENVRKLGDPKPSLVFHEKGSKATENSKKKIVKLLEYNKKQRITRPSSHGLSPFHVKNAIVKMSGGEIIDGKAHITVRDLRKDPSSKVYFEKAEFIVSEILGQGGFSTIYEVIPKDEKVRKAFEDKKLAMKISFSRLDPRSPKFSQREADARIANEISQDQSIMTKLCKIKGVKSSLETVEGLHISHPILHGTLCEEKSIVVEDFAVASPVSLSLALQGSVDKVLDSSQDQKCPPELKLDQADVLYIMREAIKIASQLSANGYVHTDLKVENIFVDKDGGIHIGDVHGMVEKQSEITYYTPRYMPPEATSRYKVAQPQVDSWALGLTAYFMLTGTWPYGINPEQEFDELLRYVGQMKNFQNFDIMAKKVKCPAIELREAGVPPVWVDIITALLDPMDFRRPALHQIVEAFPDVFKSK